MTSKSAFAVFLFIAILNFTNLTSATAQKNYPKIVDSLLVELPKAKVDTSRIKVLNDLSKYYNMVDPQKGIPHAEEALALSEKSGWVEGKATALMMAGQNLFYMGNYPESISKLTEAYDFAEQNHQEDMMGSSAMVLGLCYERIGQREAALRAYIKSSDAFRKTDYKFFNVALNNTGTAYINVQKYSEALTIATELYEYCKAHNNELGLADAYHLRGSAYLGLSNYPLALENFFEEVKILDKYNNKIKLEKSYNSIGVIFQTQGEYQTALEYYNKSLLISEELGDKKLSALTLSNIGSVYDLRSVKDTARSYYSRALDIYEEIGDPKEIGMTVYNIGGIYLTDNDFDNALEWFQRALKISRENEMGQYIGVILGQTGSAYHQMAINKDTTALMKYFKGDTTLAIETALAYTDSSVALLTEQGDLKYRAFYLNQKSRIQANLNEYEGALESYNQYAEINDSLFNIERDKKLVQAEMGYEFGRVEDSLNLASTKQKLELQNKIQLQALAYEYEAKQAAAQSEKERQELAFEEAIKRQQIENEYARKQAEAEALNQQRELERRQEEALNKAELKRQRNIRNTSLFGALGLLLFLIVVVRQRNKVKKEKARSESLLLNILPAEIAEELKAKGKADARDFEMVSILFSDFKGFTELSSTLSASDLVSEINQCFEAFDGIMGKYKIEKIKTIGDSYMAAGGLPVPSDNSIKNTVLAGLEMQDFIAHRKANMDAKGLPSFEMRVGIHTGPIVAGIVGVKKFQYDIWGDAVNTASRMESAGEIGKVNISQRTYELLKDDKDFIFESRGKIIAKGKGEIEMWFVALKTV